MVTLTVNGTEELLRDLRKAEIEVKEEAIEVLKEQADAIKKDAKDRCPEGKTGALKRSIKRSVSKKKIEGRVSAGGKVQGIDTYYAQFIEFGTKNMPAQPFLFPAARAHEAETEEKLTEALFEALKRGVEG